MVRKSFIIISLIGVIAAAGCVKNTYDMTTLSKWGHLSPTLAVSAVYGDIKLSDILKPSDTVVFGSDNFIKLVFKKDSVVNFKLSDYYDLNNMVSYTNTFPIGALALDPFLGTLSFPLGQISSHFTPALQAQFIALDDGGTHPFPSFPAVNMGETPYSAFTNFEYATFSQGSIDVSVKNNLTAPLTGVTVTLYNTAGHTQIGSPVTISAIAAGSTGMSSINIAGLTVKNAITAAITINGSPGNSTPVIISLSGSNVQISISGRDMKVLSGKVIIPSQSLTSFTEGDTIPFDPGTGIEVSYIKMRSGNLSYTLNSGTPLKASVSVTLPSALRSGTPISESLIVNPNASASGNISVSNSTIDLSKKVSHPYNLLPVTSSINVSSQNSMVIFSSTDNVKLTLSFLNPNFEYVKGYFGQQTETIKKDTLDLSIKDIMDHITGSFLVSNPSININYTNSFAIPVRITLDAAGYKKSDVVQLGLAPVTLSYPAAPADTVKSDVFSVNKTNSQLPQLISMPPERIIFSGNAMMNPAGNTGARDNYLFSSSHFIGNLEVVVPLEFRMNNLQFADTVKNFMKDTNTGNSPIKPEDFDFLRVDITADNGFPLGVSLKMVLYDSASHAHVSTIDATDVLKAAPVDANGKVTAPVSTATSITINHQFWNSINTADKIIFVFSMNTTDSGSKDVKIYSDYKINFKAALVLKPDIKFSLK